MPRNGGGSGRDERHDRLTALEAADERGDEPPARRQRQAQGADRYAIEGPSSLDAHAVSIRL
jgi:hypothetical protein